MKKLFNQFLNNFGYRIQKNISKEQKIFNTQKELSSKTKPLTIFDVGAYEGETVKKYKEIFGAQCTIHAFEPFEETFQKLKRNTASLTNVKLHKLVIGEKNKLADFNINEFTATNSLLASDPSADKYWGKGLMHTKEVIQVPMQTIDALVIENNIDCIDILKMDTQGAEHLVLEGAKESIKQGKIKLIFTEMIVMPTYENQKELHELFEMYHSYGFELYNLYNSVDQKGQLRFLDAIFILKC